MSVLALRSLNHVSFPVRDLERSVRGTYARACAGLAPTATGDALHANTVGLFTRALAKIEDS